MRQERGVSLTSLIVTLAVLALLGLFAAKLMPSYIEYFQVKKVFTAMANGGDLNGNPREIRNAFDRRNAIEDIHSVRGSDLEISKDGAETVISVTWSVRVPVIYNASACLDFFVTSAK
jgi:hypothetical protein